MILNKHFILATTSRLVDAWEWRGIDFQVSPYTQWIKTDSAAATDADTRCGYNLT